MQRRCSLPQDDKLFYGFTDPTTYQGEYNRLRYVIESRLSKMETSLPVRVDAVKGGGVAPVGLVDVTVLVSQVTGDGRTVPGVSIPNVPYVRYQGGANAVIIDPQPGDIGMAIFSSRDISAVKSARASAPPGSARMYDFSDAVYLGGMLNGAPTHYIHFTGSGIVIRSPGEVRVKADSATVIATESATVTAPAVTLGSGSGSVENLVDERFLVLFNEHTHLSAAPGDPTSNPLQEAGVGQLTSATKAN